MDQFDNRNPRIDTALSRVPGLDMTSDFGVDLDTNINDLIASEGTLGAIGDNKHFSARALFYANARDSCQTSTLREVLLALVDGSIPEAVVSKWLQEDKSIELAEAELIRRGYPELFKSYLTSNKLDIDTWDQMINDERSG